MSMIDHLLRENPELVDFFKTVRYALERCVPLIESKLVGISRYLGSKYIKRGKHLREITRKFPALVVRKRTRYRLTSAGREVLSHVIHHPYPYIPLQLRIIKDPEDLVVKYCLDGYFLERNGKRVLKTMKYNAGVLFLKNGAFSKSPVTAEDVVGIINYVDKSCEATFNLDDEIRVEAYPKIAYLFWYVATRIDKIRDPNLRYLVAKFPDKIFRQIRKIDGDLWRIETPYGGVLICSKCVSNRCEHIMGKIRLPEE